MSERPLGAEDTGPPPEARLAQVLGMLTVATGVNVVVVPRLVLRLLGAPRRQPSPYLLQVIGMFIAISGGLLVDAARAAPKRGGGVARGGNDVALRWSFAQKLAVVIAVVLGVRSGRLGRQALGVAAFDAVSAAVIAKLLLAPRA